MVWESPLPTEMLLLFPLPGKSPSSQYIGFSPLIFFLRSILHLPWDVNHKHLSLDYGSLSVHNSCHLS